MQFRLALKTHFVTQAGLELRRSSCLTPTPPQPPNCWDYSRVPPSLAVLGLYILVGEIVYSKCCFLKFSIFKKRDLCSDPLATAFEVASRWPELCFLSHLISVLLILSFVCLVVSFSFVQTGSQLYSLGWIPTWQCNPPVSASWMLGLEVYATMSGELLPPFPKMRQ